MYKLTFFLILIFQLNVFSQQNITVDLVAHQNIENKLLDLNSVLDEAINTKSEGCIQYNKASSFETANNDYVIEFWDSKSTYWNAVFKEKRTKKEGLGDEAKTINYTAKGMFVTLSYVIYGSLREKSTGRLIDTYRIGGNVRHEFELNGEDQAKIPNKGSSNYASFNKYAKEVYQENIEDTKNRIVQSYHSRIIGGLDESIAKYVLPRAEVTGIKEMKKDKVKKVDVNICKEHELGTSGLLYNPLVAVTEIGGEKIFRKIGSCYKDKEEGVFGIRKGEKELKPLMDGGAKILISKVDNAHPEGISTSQKEDSKNIAFVFSYEYPTLYTTFEKKQLELTFQSTYLDFDNINVITNNPRAATLNKTLSGEKEFTDIDSEALVTQDDVQIMWVKISNPLNAVGNPIQSQILTKKVDKKASQIRFQTSIGSGDDEIIDSGMMPMFVGSAGTLVSKYNMYLEKTMNVIVDSNAKIIGIGESKKDKVNTVYISTNAEVFKKDEFKIYERERRTKKEKPVAEIKVIEELGKFCALAEVEGKQKDLKVLIDNNKTMFIEREKIGGLMSLVATANNAELLTYPIGKVRKIAVYSKKF